MRRERINNENYLVLYIPSSVDASAFRLMVDNIGKTPSAATSPTSRTADLSFVEFFGLCIVLWSYVCRIDHWVPTAEHIRALHWEDDFLQWPPGRLTQWLFVALVFNWPDIFEKASKALIVDFSELDTELGRAWYLPDDVIGKYAANGFASLRHQLLFPPFPSPAYASDRCHDQPQARLYAKDIRRDSKHHFISHLQSAETTAVIAA
jgi:hypothetical protein